MSEEKRLADFRRRYVIDHTANGLYQLSVSINNGTTEVTLHADRQIRFISDACERINQIDHDLDLVAGSLTVPNQ